MARAARPGTPSAPPNQQVEAGTQLPGSWHFKAQHLHLVATSNIATEGMALPFHNSKRWNLASGICLFKLKHSDRHCPLAEGSIHWACP